MKPLKDRLHFRLYEPDLAAVREALLQYALHHNHDGRDLRITKQVMQDVLPFTARLNPDWIAIEKCVGWPESKAFEHYNEYLKNLVRQRGHYLAQRIKLAREEHESAGSMKKEDEETSAKRGSKSKKALGKRGQPDDGQIGDEEGEIQAPLKFIKTDPGPETTGQIVDAPATARSLYMRVECEGDLNDLFREFRLITNNVSSKKAELDLLYQKWSALKRQLGPYLEDPTLDQ